MEKGYFYRVNQQTENRFWINNPTPSEAEKAIEAGAISCTTNPTYVSKQIKTESEHDYCLQIIDEVIKETKDSKKAAVLVQRRLVKRILDIFLPLYEKNMGQFGFVSIQGDPYAEEDPNSIISEAFGGIYQIERFYEGFVVGHRKNDFCERTCVSSGLYVVGNR